MSIISFQNPGVIDKRCITIAGVSVKENDNPIGFFGTGLKYAIAIILRAGGRITIYAGLEKLEFGVNTSTIRNSEFDVVTLNGVDLGFTTDLGKTWQMWQAFREIWCNNQDERGICEEDVLLPKEGYTTIIINCVSFVSAYRRIDEFFVREEPTYIGANVAFTRRRSSDIFYRGVRVSSDREKPWAFTPNVIERLDLTEDRTLKYSWEVTGKIASDIRACHNKTFLEKWLLASTGCREHQLNLQTSSTPVSKEFLEIVEQYMGDESHHLNLSAIAIYGESKPLIMPVPTLLSDVEQAMIDRAIDFCNSLGYPVDKFPIVPVLDLGKTIYAKADRDRNIILISKRAIHQGNLFLAVTLIEEWAHIELGLDDATREMQNWLFEQIGILGERLLTE